MLIDVNVAIDTAVVQDVFVKFKKVVCLLKHVVFFIGSSALTFLRYTIMLKKFANIIFTSHSSEI